VDENKNKVMDTRLTEEQEWERYTQIANDKVRMPAHRPVVYDYYDTQT